MVRKTILIIRNKIFVSFCTIKSFCIKIHLKFQLISKVKKDKTLNLVNLQKSSKSFI